MNFIATEILKNTAKIAKKTKKNMAKKTGEKVCKKIAKLVPGAGAVVSASCIADAAAEGKNASVALQTASMVAAQIPGPGTVVSIGIEVVDFVFCCAAYD